MKSKLDQHFESGVPICFIRVIQIYQDILFIFSNKRRILHNNRGE